MSGSKSVSHSTVGVVYVATGKKHRARAIVSARSLKRAMPALPAVLYTDIASSVEGFQKTITIDRPALDFSDKINACGLSPFEKTIFLDADTYVCEDFGEVFNLLDAFELAVAHDTYRIHTLDHARVQERIARVPASFPMLNTGVIVYRKSERVERLFEEWGRIHGENVAATAQAQHWYCGDQAAFREALFMSDVRFTVLPPEYNCRFVTPVFLNERAKVLHGPCSDYGGLVKEINHVAGNRVFLPGLGTITEKTPLVLTKWKVRRLLACLYARVRAAGIAIMRPVRT